VGDHSDKNMTITDYREWYPMNLAIVTCADDGIL